MQVTRLRITYACEWEKMACGKYQGPLEIGKRTKGAKGQKDEGKARGRALSRVRIEFAEDLHFVLCNSCGHVVRRLPR